MICELCHDTAVLSTRCTRATADDAAVAQDLLDTMASIEDCACLAANQIGKTVALVAFVDEQNKPHVMYNPRIMMGLGAQKVEEQCMTLNEPTKSTRYAKVKVAFQELVDGKLVDKKRDYVGWEAQMIQHLCDHCAGKLV